MQRLLIAVACFVPVILLTPVRSSLGEQSGVVAPSPLVIDIEGDGYRLSSEVLAEARHRASQVPIVILTAFDAAGAERAARTLGAAAFVHKPWDLDDLVTLVSKHVKVNASTQDTGPDRPLAYALSRWVDLVVATARGGRDVTTQAEWGQIYAHGASKTTLQRWCKPFDVTPDDSLDFARALRIVVHHAGREVNVWNVLDIADPKTMRRFLSRSGLAEGECVPDLRPFLIAQRFISDSDLMAAVEEALGRFSG